jgi:hypothetical protein
VPNHSCSYAPKIISFAAFLANLVGVGVAGRPAPGAALVRNCFVYVQIPKWVRARQEQLEADVRRSWTPPEHRIRLVA